MSFDQTICKHIQFIDLLLSIFLFIFFYYQKIVKRRCKFEVLYVTGVGSLTDLVKLTITNELPASYVIENNGVLFNWSQFLGWMITCPVLLIHLSNLAGKDVFDVRRMMKILVIYQILMVSGATASMCNNGLKWLFFGVSLISLLKIYIYAHNIFQESREIMPKRANVVINWISFVFYVSWSGFGVSWFFSPNGISFFSDYTTKALFAFFDIMSKNVYSMLGWYLRWYIIRKFDNPEEFVEQYQEEEEKKINILLVENNAIYSHYFDNILIQHGCTVDVSKNIDELLFMTSNNDRQYDMIFMNKTMAIENSYKMMYEIRKRMFMLPVIVYGRDITEYDMMNRNNTGIDDFLIAPFPDDLLKKKLLQWSRRASINPLLTTNLNTNSNNIMNHIDIVIKSLNDLRSSKQFVS